MLLTIFLIIVAATLLASFFCSLSEAALYSVPLGYTKHLAESGSKAGKILLGFKKDIGRPVAAILIVNTLANTTGPAVAGALAADIWGDSAVGWFAVIITLSVLVLGEITPKIAGVTYCRPLSRFLAFPLLAMISILWPFMWVSRLISAALEPAQEKPTVSHEEVLSMTAIGRQEGSIDHLEGSVIANVIGLDKVLVRDVLTPRVVVFRVCQDTRIADLSKQVLEWSFTRIPIYSEDEPDLLTHYVTQIDVYRALMEGAGERTLRDIARLLTTVPELLSVDKLLMQMLEKKEQMCAVVDEYGALAGIITMEDILEEIVGREIVDEYDTVGDMRGFAGALHAARIKRRSVTHPKKSGST